MSTLCILSFGDSAACSYLPWRLSTSHGNQVVVVESSCVNKSDSSIDWTSPKNGDTKFFPTLVARNLEGLQQVKQRFPIFDIIFLSGNTYEELIKFGKEAKAFVGDETVVLIDSSTSIGLESELLSFFSDVPIFAIVCDAEVRLIKEDNKIKYLLKGYNNITVIGSTQESKISVSKALKGEGILGQKLNSLTEHLKASDVNSCYIIPSGINPTIKSFAWKKIIPFLSFGIMSIIYPKLDLSKERSKSVVRGVFNNLLQLARKNGALDLPDPLDSAKSDRVFMQMLREHNQKYPYNYIRSNPKTIDSPNDLDIDFVLDSTPCVYHFGTNSRTYIPIALTQIKSLTVNYELELPYIDCTVMSFQEIEKVRESNIFNWVTRIPPRQPTLIQPVPMQMYPQYFPPPQQPPQHPRHQLAQQYQQQYQQHPNQQPQMPNMQYQQQLHFVPQPNMRQVSNNSNGTANPTMGNIYVAPQQSTKPVATAAIYYGTSSTGAPSHNNAAGSMGSRNTSIHSNGTQRSNISQLSRQSQPGQAKTTLYRNVSNSSSIYSEDLSRAQGNVLHHANIKQCFDTNLQYGEYIELSRMKFGSSSTSVNDNSSSGRVSIYEDSRSDTIPEQNNN